MYIKIVSVLILKYFINLITVLLLVFYLIVASVTLQDFYDFTSCLGWSGCLKLFFSIIPSAASVTVCPSVMTPGHNVPFVCLVRAFCVFPVVCPTYVQVHDWLDGGAQRFKRSLSHHLGRCSGLSPL